MEYLFAGITAGLGLLLASWGIELVAGRRRPDLQLSREERNSHQRTEKLLRVFGEQGLPKMTRRAIWDSVSWIWQSSRVIALRSGRWSAIFWLALQGLACLAVVFKASLFPQSHDLRLLLGGRDFLTFFVAEKRQSRRTVKPRVEPVRQPPD